MLTTAQQEALRAVQAAYPGARMALINQFGGAGYELSNVVESALAKALVLAAEDSPKSR
jgi:hypothetical protein